MSPILAICLLCATCYMGGMVTALAAVFFMMGRAE